MTVIKSLFYLQKISKTYIPPPYRSNRLACILAACFGLSACGGSSEEGSNKELTPTYHEITVIDGYVRGAVAFIDLDNDKIKDDNEPSVITGEGGFGRIETTSLDISLDDIRVVVQVPAGAVDESTITENNPDGIEITEENAYQMLSLPGEGVATPLTTLVALTAGDNVDIDTARTKVAQSLNIPEDKVSGDYIKDGDAKLTVLTEQLIKNKVLPQELTTEVSSADLLVITTVTSKISSIVNDFYQAGMLAKDNPIIDAIAAITTQAVSKFIHENKEDLNETTIGNFSSVIEEISETTSNSFKELIESQEVVTTDDIALAAEHSQVMGDVVTDLLSEYVKSDETINEGILSEVNMIADIIANTVNSLLKTSKNPSEGDVEVIKVALLVAESITKELVEYKNSDLTDDEIDSLLSNSASDVSKSLEELAKGGADLSDLDGDGITNDIDDDIDGDLTANESDAFPFDATESIDTDGDNIGNNKDTDDDNDDVLDSDDAFSLDNTESVDTDGDGVGNNADSDDDGDGFLDTDEIAAETDPLSNESLPLDTDGDFISNVTDDDDDGDGFLDTDEIAAATDPLSNDSLPLDTDGDLISNVTDTDDDNDGVPDINDIFPLNSAESVDTDGDGIGDNADPNPAMPGPVSGNVNSLDVDGKNQIITIDDAIINGDVTIFNTQQVEINSMEVIGTLIINN